jgi:hypothetical protein
MTAFGYEKDQVNLSALERFQFLLFDIPLNYLRMLVWTVRESFLNRVGRSLPGYRIVRDAEQVGANV